MKLLDYQLEILRDELNMRINDWEDSLYEGYCDDEIADSYLYVLRLVAANLDRMYLRCDDDEYLIKRGREYKVQ